MADTGLGTPAADLDRVFDPFERPGAEQTAIEGTGIGLARAFAEAMAGHFTVVSARAEGTTFAVTMPRMPDMVRDPQYHGVASIPLPAPGGDGPAGTVTRILCIEDNPANIEVVARFLRIRRQMRACGVIACLTKPLDLTGLGQLLDSFVAGHDHKADPAPRTVPAP